MSTPFFFFNDTATTEIYTLSLHDALPISLNNLDMRHAVQMMRMLRGMADELGRTVVLVVHDVNVASCYSDRIVADRKSTRLNSSHANISYAVFCLKKKKHV